MDDALTEPIDSGLLSLNDHINIEVRVFNPFPRRRSRLISFIANFNILNRRMHNKSFTVDNQLAIVGGRNIGDEYFGANPDVAFGDMDAALMGVSAKERVLARREQRRRAEAEARESDLMNARQRYFQERVIADNAQRSQYLGSRVTECRC